MNIEDFNLVDLTKEPISVADIKFYTGREFSTSEAYDNNEELTKQYSHVVKSFGYTSFFDMVLDAENNHKYLRKSNKDYDNLDKVKRQVIRNGKATEMTFYEDGDKEGDDSSQEVKYTNTILGDIGKKPNPKDLLALKKELNGNLEDGHDLYLVVSNGSQVDGVGYVNVEDNYLCLDGFYSIPDSKGVASSLVLQAIKLSIEEELGIKVFYPSVKTAKYYLSHLGFNDKGTHFELTQSEVSSFVGDFYAID